jgi:hypothetical protein
VTSSLAYLLFRKPTAVDDEVHGLDDALVGVASPIALQKFELHLIERIDIGKAVRSCQCGTALKQRLLPEDRKQRLLGTFAQFRIIDQFLIAGSDS